MTHLSAFWLCAGPVLASALFALVGDAVSGSGDRRTAVGAGLLLCAGGLAGLMAGSLLAPASVHGAFIAGGGFSSVTGLACLLAGLTVLGAAAGRFAEPAQLAALVALASCGLVVVGGTRDLLLLLLGLEIVAVSGYALIAARRSTGANEAALKYFVLSSVATALFLVGFAIVAALEGTVPAVDSLSAVASAFAGPGAISLMVLLVGALAIKAGAAPFHWWAPDAYASAPEESAAFLAGPVKLAVVAALASLAVEGLPVERAGSFSAAPAAATLAMAMAVLSCASIVIGSLGALAQRDLARMLGYAGVAQVGYALMAVSGMQPVAAVVHIAAYAVGATVAFLALRSIRDARPDWDGSVAGLAGLGRSRPVQAASLSVALMSMAGLPPLIGFWGKFLVFISAVRAAQASAAAGDGVWMWVFIGLLAVAAVGAVVSIGYYGRVIASLYFDEAAVRESEFPGTGSAIVAACCAVMVIVAGLWPLVGGLPVLLEAFTRVP